MKKIDVIGALLLFAVSSTAAAEFAASPPKGNWAKVRALPKGQQVELELKQGETINGEFQHLDGNAIFLLTHGLDRMYPKSDVSVVRMFQRGSRKKNAAIAGGILFALGFAAGYAVGPYMADMEPSAMGTGERVGAATFFGAVWGGAAAGIAAAVRPGEKKTVIYRSQ
jgi:hypothetical protein